jgi:class 3 adenylate cyclase
MSATPHEGRHGALPTGTVTFAFTDIEGSTARWERHPNEMEWALRRHDELLRSAFASHGGHIFKTVGDAFCVAFWRPTDAVAATLAVQAALAAEDFSAVDGLRVRAAVHTGTANAALTRQGFEREFTETTTYNRLTALLCERLSSHELARLTAEGAALGPEAAIALALEEP